MNAGAGTLHYTTYVFYTLAYSTLSKNNPGAISDLELQLSFINEFYNLVLNYTVVKIFLTVLRFLRVLFP